MVDKILRRYIVIGRIEPLVVENILRRYIGIGDVEPFVVENINVRGR